MWIDSAIGKISNLFIWAKHIKVFHISLGAGGPEGYLGQNYAEMLYLAEKKWTANCEDY